MKLPLLFIAALLAAATPVFANGIVCAADAPTPVRLAAKEIRRYAYMRTGTLLDIAPETSGKRVVLRVDPTLAKQEYRLKTVGDTLTVSGGTPVGVLYGAYALAEKWGVRFQIDGDILPDEKIPFALPLIDETSAPAFETRGIVPYHDFPEGPDWWTFDDYRAVTEQVAKMRMNFIGMHAYNNEPLLWRGVAADVNADGSVKTPHSANWFNGKGWSFARLNTSRFCGGASGFFTTDETNPPISGCEGARTMLRNLVADAHARGIKVCVGTEAPLMVPGRAQARLKELRVPKKDWAKETYKGIFTWLMKNAPVDYYWIWTSEDWIWNGNSTAQYHAVEDDINSALAAVRESGATFPVGACGWVLGPKQDRSAWDRTLPKDSPIANINMNVAHSPIDGTFSKVSARPKWAIPWLENDPDMIAYQPWVKRLRFDAADALRLGCTGYLGVHWRTTGVAANASALARAGWAPPAAPEAELLAARAKDGGLARGLPANEFYTDFAGSNFGSDVAEAAGAVLSECDGFATGFGPTHANHFAATAVWDGPGNMRVVREPWAKWKAAHYGFAEKFAALRPRVHGAGNLARFDHTADTLRATEKIAELACMRGALNDIMDKAKSEKDPVRLKALSADALAARLTLVRGWDDLMRLQVSLVTSPGELGTIANLEMHSRTSKQFINYHDKRLAEMLGTPLPAECAPSMTYTGPARLTVLGSRGSLTRGEAQSLRILAYAPTPVKNIILHVRPLGGVAWTDIPARPIARAVYEGLLPAASEDFEYFVTAEGGLIWPAGAPGVCRTVIVTE